MIKYIFLTICLLISKCNTSPDILYLDKDSNDGLIEILLNEELIISLDANPTTGYTWIISTLDTNIVKQSQDVKYQSESKKMGAPGKQIFQFKAVKTGSTELKLDYLRPWEHEIAPLDSFRLAITVKKS